MSSELDERKSWKNVKSLSQVVMSGVIQFSGGDWRADKMAEPLRKAGRCPLIQELTAAKTQIVDSMTARKEDLSRDAKMQSEELEQLSRIQQWSQSSWKGRCKG